MFLSKRSARLFVAGILLSCRNNRCESRYPFSLVARLKIFNRKQGGSHFLYYFKKKDIVCHLLMLYYIMKFNRYSLCFLLRALYVGVEKSMVMVRLQLYTLILENGKFIIKYYNSKKVFCYGT